MKDNRRDISMKYNLTILFAVANAWIATVVTTSVATAQTAEFGTPQQNGVPEPGMRPPLFEVTLESSYTAAGKAKFCGADFSDSDAYNVSLGLRTRAPLNELSLPQYNDALGTYSDIRIGAGVGYRISQTLTVESDAGYSVDRRIDYTRIDERVKFDPAPYAGFGLRLSF